MYLQKIEFSASKLVLTLIWHSETWEAYFIKWTTSGEPPVGFKKPWHLNSGNKKQIHIFGPSIKKTLYIGEHDSNALQILLGEVWRYHSAQSVDKAEEWYSEDKHPPDPKDKEVFLIKQIVLESAQEVLRVGAASRSSPVNETWDLEINNW